MNDSSNQFSATAMQHQFFHHHHHHGGHSSNNNTNFGGNSNNNSNNNTAAGSNNSNNNNTQGMFNPAMMHHHHHQHFSGHAHHNQFGMMPPPPPPLPGAFGGFNPQMNNNANNMNNSNNNNNNYNGGGGNRRQRDNNNNNNMNNKRNNNTNSNNNNNNNNNNSHVLNNGNPTVLNNGLVSITIGHNNNVPGAERNNEIGDPARVLHLRNVTPEVSQLSIQNLVASFGRIRNIVMLRQKNQALIEMETLQSAQQMVDFFKDPGYAEIDGRRVYLRYSLHNELTASVTTSKAILVSMFNTQYDVSAAAQITPMIVYQIFGNYGQVEKIVVLPKNDSAAQNHNRVQALVQFESKDVAEQVKNMLQGQPVTLGETITFTLDIQFSRMEEIKTSSPHNSLVIPKGATPSSLLQQQQQAAAAAQQQGSAGTTTTAPGSWN